MQIRKSSSASVSLVGAAASAALVAMILATGCERAHAAGNVASVPSNPAPFATLPVLPGTPDVATLVARVKPAVVNITTTHNVRSPRADSEAPFGFDLFGNGGDASPFGRRGSPRGGEGEQTLKQRALGSGFLIDSQGHVVTNAHVVEQADTVRVRLSDDREYDAKVKGRDERLDLAVLELQGAKDLPAVSLGSSEELRVGEYVVAIGNPFGLGDTVTMGIVSAKSRTIGAGPYDDFIQTDASINPGNSGGPLFNLRGQVVGINSAINPQGRGIGFAIPVDALKDVLPELVSSGHVARGHLGALIQPVDPPLAKALGLDRPTGALVGEVEKAGPADRAGLRSGDVILSVDGADVPHGNDLPRMIARRAPGTKVTLKVLREGRTMTSDVTLDRLSEPARNRPATQDEDEAAPVTVPGDGLGFTVSDAPGGGAQVERVEPGGAAEGQLQPGDVIVEANRGVVERATDLARRVESSGAGRAALLKLRRGGHTIWVGLQKH
jgi:serine protease Do